ncbi:MAG: RDD family protein [Xanthomonadales bacterium]|nr:RDD family protein [Xanthomonadales bacterium]
MAAAAPAAAAFASSVAAGDLLPEGGIVHAGFWRRCAAYVLDSIILSIAFLIIMGLVGLATAALIAGEHFGMVGLIMFVAYVGLIVSAWLYFAKLESGPSQATIGKRVMGIKVTDDRGQRIGFGRATGRFFGKIISGMIMNIGYLMAGFTGRKQALHDMMAGCCVVFREVEPGRPLPSVRPPMPWYGWALNILMFAGIVGGIAVYAYLISTMIGLGSRFPGSSMSSDPAPSFPTSSSTQDSDSSTSSSNDTSSSSSGVDEGDKATIRAGLTAVFMVASATQSEVATIADGGGDCPTEERSSDNAWIESIQLGGISPQCTVTIRLSSSSDIPFAARIERIEWSYAGSGNWRCESSMASDLLPFTCN